MKRGKLTGKNIKRSKSKKRNLKKPSKRKKVVKKVKSSRKVKRTRIKKIKKREFKKNIQIDSKTEEEIIKRVEKIKASREKDRRTKINIIGLAILLLLLIILMYLGSSIKSNLLMSQCSDSDYGKNEFMYGSVRCLKNGELLTFSDKCIDEYHLEEYYCQDGKLEKEIINCKNGCSGGVCIHSI